MTINASDLVAYVVKAVGGGYCWGADGQRCSPAVREELAGRTSSASTKKNLLETCAKWDGKRVWDCSGLFRGAWRELASYRSGGATGIYKTWCSETGTIDTMPHVPGIAVFRADGSGMAHIGLYIGGGEVVDARSSAKGVLRGALESYGKWSHWGRLSQVAYDLTDAPAADPAADDTKTRWVGRVKTRTGSGVSIWSDAQKSASLVRVPEGGEVAVLETAHEGFVRAEYGGHVGVADAQYLCDVDEMRETEGDINVFIPRLTRAEADALLRKYAGAYELPQIGVEVRG